MNEDPARRRSYDSRSIWSWTLYDFANSPFTTLVVTFIYPVFFSQVVVGDEIAGTTIWSRAVTITALIVAVLSPFLGALADRGGYRKEFLAVATVVCIGGSSALYFLGTGQVLQAFVWFVVANTAFEMVMVGTFATKLVLIVLALGSLLSWWLIFHKARQFREVRLQGDRFLDHMEQAQRLEDAYKSILSLPDSPYGRVFRQGVNFFSELRPGALREGAAPSPGLSLTQLEALRLVLEKEEAEERDELAQGIVWLAVIGSVSPLMGLAGTVIGSAM